jgi:hypothetical protein
MTNKTYSGKYSICCALLFLSFVSMMPADASAYENSNAFGKNTTKHRLMAVGEKGMGSNVQTRSHRPLSTEIVLTSISGEIYLNPEYIGKIASITPVGTESSPRSKPEIEFNHTEDLWPVVIVPQSISNLRGLDVTGEEGSLRISGSGGEKTPNGDELGTITRPRVGNGQLSSTILFQETKVTEPSKFKIAVFDFKGNRFINGHIIALTNDQMAVKFENLPSTVISKEGKLRYSLKEQDGTFINSDLAAWGYEIIIPDTDVGKAVPIKANIFGLPDESKVKFTFQASQGQRFSSPVNTLSVKEINSGEPITMISTSIGGDQPIRVSVQESS